MADRVASIMERMAGQLDEFRRLELFSDAEIRSLVERRRNFEYALHRRVPLKCDFIRAIQYELNLETLRRHRKKKLEIDITAACDFSGIRRVFFLYQRAIQKFPDDVSLWHQFLDYGIHIGSSRALGRQFARVLQLHPTKPEFWIKAMAWEFDTNNNVKAARVFMQRGLRMNQHNSKSLWLAFFKMEVQYIRRLRKRRELIQTATTSEEVNDENADEHSKQEQFLSGVVPRLLFDKAIQQVSDDSEFRLRFIEMIPKDESAFVGLLQHIFESIQRDFPTIVSCWNARASYALRTSSNDAIAVLKEAIVSCENSIEAWDMAVSFAHQKMCSDEIDEELLWKQTLLQLAEAAEREDRCSEAILLLWCNTLLQAGDVKEAIALSSKACSSAKHSSSASIWMLNVNLRLRESVVRNTLKQDLAKLVVLHRQALAKITDSSQVWASLIRTHLLVSSPDELVLDLINESISSLGEHPSQEQLQLYSIALEWCSSRISCSSSSSQVLDLLFKLASNAPSAEFATSSLRVLSCSKSNLELRPLYERALVQFGVSNPELWLCCIELETHALDLSRVQHLQWRARTTLNDPDTFVQMLNLVRSQ